MKQTTGASVTNCFHGNKLFRDGKEEDGLIYQKTGQEEQHFLLQSTHTKFGKHKLFLVTSPNLCATCLGSKQRGQDMNTNNFGCGAP
jgi:hypothetical protein